MDYKYKQLVRRALEAWESVSGGSVKFVHTSVLLESNINVEWRRVDRKALGHCHFHYDPSGRLYGAEVSIGLSDGLIHQQYMDENEVYHTILHEIGHAIGLGHSSNPNDIMYTPHRYGVINLSHGDAETVKWLYKLPQGITAKQFAQKHSMMTNNIDDVITKVTNKSSGNTKGEFPNSSKNRDLLKESENIGDLKKYHISLQNVGISDDMKKFFNKPPQQ